MGRGRIGTIHRGAQERLRGALTGHYAARKRADSAFIFDSKKLLIIFTKMKCSFHIGPIYYNRAQERKHRAHFHLLPSFPFFLRTGMSAARHRADSDLKLTPLFYNCPLPALQAGSAADQKQSPLRIRNCIRCAEVFLISANTFRAVWNDNGTEERAAFPKKGRGKTHCKMKMKRRAACGKSAAPFRFRKASAPLPRLSAQQPC